MTQSARRHMVGSGETTRGPEEIPLRTARAGVWRMGDADGAWMIPSSSRQISHRRDIEARHPLHHGHDYYDESVLC